MSEKENFERLDMLKARMTRRKAVGTAAKVAGAAVAGLVVGGIVGYFAKPAAPAETVTVPTTIRETVTTTVAAAERTVTTTVRETVTTTVTAAPVAPGLAEMRRELAQRYATGKPGEKFLVGYVTWTLAQEAPKYDYQGADQACKQLELDFKGIEIGAEALKAVEATDSLIAAGAKGVVYWAPALAAMEEIVRLCEANKVFAATAWCRDPALLPGDRGPYWFLEFSTMSDEMSFHCMTLLFEKMRKYGKSKVLHVQSSKTIAPDSTALINQGISIAWRRYPFILLLGHYWGEWAYPGGRKAGEDALAVRTDYEAVWGHNDDQAMGTVSVFKERGIDIGPFAAARDAIVACVEEVIKGAWFVTSLTEFQYFGGKRVADTYDAVTGASYPLRDEMVQSPWVTTVLNLSTSGVKEENEELIKNSGLWWHPNFIVVDAAKLLDFLKISEVYPSTLYPYDFRTLSVGKCKELNLTYDRHAKNYLTANDFYYVPLMGRMKVTEDRTKGENLESFRKQFGLTMKYFLDLNWDTWSDNEAKIKAAEAEGLKLEPLWGKVGD
ncbi:MAG: sugar ABC transporter substrate-binding protein [Aigarchaeota archaeon]|nr:sugar ABC transporter substrate-binding protein [Candidatus Wolframiiraptor gerlachensis]